MGGPDDGSGLPAWTGMGDGYRDRLPNAPEPESDDLWDDPKEDLPQWLSFDDEDSEPAPQPPMPEPVAPSSVEPTADPVTGLQRTRPRGPRLAIAGIAAAAVVVAVAITLAIVLGHNKTTRSAAPQPRQTPTVATTTTIGPTTASQVGCQATTTGPVTIGNDPGGTSGGDQVIKAFDYAYYVTRSGDAARAVVAPDAKVGTAQEIQGGIDKLDPRTRHCLKITERSAGLYGVELTEIPPDGQSPVVIYQQIQTKDANGRTWIESIIPDPQH